MADETWMEILCPLLNNQLAHNLAVSDDDRWGGSIPNKVLFLPEGFIFISDLQSISKR